jgi:histidine triad (HIT) family protein
MNCAGIMAGAIVVIWLVAFLGNLMRPGRRTAARVHAGAVPVIMDTVMNDCLFCKIVSGEIPAKIVHETPATLAFRDIAPKAPIHVLVVPKEHHADLAAAAAADPSILADVMVAAAAVAAAEGIAADGYRTITNSGRNSGMEVAHLHVHVLGGAPLGPMLAE